MKLSLKILIICLFCGGIFSLYKFIPPKYTKIQSIHIFLSSQESKQTGKKNEDSFLTPKEQKKTAFSYGKIQEPLYMEH